MHRLSAYLQPNRHSSTGMLKNPGLRVSILAMLGLASLAVGCSGASTTNPNGRTGGTTRATGGNVTGGVTISGTGGTSAATGGSNSDGATPSSGGLRTGGTGTGGAGGTANATGGTSTGGRSMGGARTGGASTGGTGGTAPVTGGISTGGAGGLNAGGTSAGGSATGGTTATGGTSAGGGTGGNTGPIVSGNCIETPISEMVGWATQEGLGLKSTTGGGNATPTVVTDLAALNSALKGTTAQVIHVKGKITGKVTLDDSANKTIIGCGASITGNIMMENSNNVIIQNLKLVSTNPDIGATDLLTIDNQSHHIWLDHLDFLDGADENLSIVHGSDYITVSWTKFHYTTKPPLVPGDTVPGGHQFSNLIGGQNENGAEDTGHLKTTFHHCVWGDNVMERMPRVRFGQVHLFNNLLAASGGYTTTYAIRVGVSANVRTENNIFKGINNPFDFNDSNAEARAESIGDSFIDCTGLIDIKDKGPAFTPTYPYTKEPIEGLEQKIRAGVGPR